MCCGNWGVLSVDLSNPVVFLWSILSAITIMPLDPIENLQTD